MRLIAIYVATAIMLDRYYPSCKASPLLNLFGFKVSDVLFFSPPHEQWQPKRT